jgi:DDE superfamily endonuclease
MSSPTAAPEWHFTPTYSSWLNLIERWFAELTNKQIRRGAHRSVQELERAIQGFIDAQNAAPRPSHGPRVPTTSWPASNASPGAPLAFTAARLNTRTTDTGH